MNISSKTKTNSKERKASTTRTKAASRAAPVIKIYQEATNYNNFSKIQMLNSSKLKYSMISVPSSKPATTTYNPETKLPTSNLETRRKY